MIDWTQYHKGYDHARTCFINKGTARACALTISAELGLSAQAAQVEGKRGEFHILIPFASTYFSPHTPGGWQYEFERVADAMKKARMA